MREMNADTSKVSLEELAQWEKDFNEAMNAERAEEGWMDDAAYAEKVTAQFADLDKEFGLPTYPLHVDEDGIPVMVPYTFGMFTLFGKHTNILT